MKSLLRFFLPLIAFQATFAQEWTTVVPGTAVSGALYAESFLTPQLGWVGGEGSVIRKTTDGGVTWTAQSGQQNITDLQMFNANLGYATCGSGGTGAVLKTTNGGTSWVSAASSLTVMWDVFMLDSTHAWAVGASGSIQATSNGSTWTSQPSGTSTDLRTIGFADANTGYAAGLSGKILKTTNGGSSWSPLTSGVTNNLHEIRVLSADTIWVAGEGGRLLKSTNAGATWTPQASGTTADLVALFFLNRSVAYAGGGNGTLIKTTDGGATWQAQASGTTQVLLTIQTFAGENGWISAGTGTLLKKLSPVPANLSYASNPATYLRGTAIVANTPSLTGTGPFTWSVSPALPAGLSLDPSSGLLTGTPAVASASTSYVVTVTNSYGSTTANLGLTVLEPPSGLTYTAYPAPQYSVGTAITPNVPSVSGTVTRYTVTPALPAGLKMDSVTGIISGTPTAVWAAANYLITASNGIGGSTTVTLNITVSQKPSNLSYSLNPAEYLEGVAITANAPSLPAGGKVTYTVSPALPAGLTLNALTGVISGTPSTAAATGYYTVTATNSSGSTICVLVISVAQNTAIARSRAGQSGFGFTTPGGADLHFQVPAAAAQARAEIFSLRGKEIWSSVQATPADLSWNGRTQDGTALPHGVYGLRIVWMDHGGKSLGTSVRRFTLMR